MHLTHAITLLRKHAPVRNAGAALGGLTVAAVVATTPIPAMAQDDTEARLRRAEAEIRALQRTVFPGGDGRFFEPSIPANGGQQPTRTTAQTTARPSTTAVTDILARLDAMETQIQRLTAKTEENTNALSALDTRLVALEGGGAARTLPSGSPSGTEITDPATNRNLGVMTGAGSSTGSNTGLGAGNGNGGQSQPSGTPTTSPSAERLAGVQAITKPQTDDAGDDEYSYGFRLWDAGYYPEARQQLASFVEAYPTHSRITYGRNLLGRAFLDDGMPEEAARWFLRNYQADRTALRAPDSLLFLAQSMIAMDDTPRACIALAEFGETYPAVAAGRLASTYQSNLQKVSCDN